jgi:small subunit ribosomal protein S16
MGRKKTPHYRVVVTDRTAPREGRFVESIGYYKPLNQPARLVLDLERVDYWIAQGAVPSDTVGSLIRKARIGGDDSLAVGEVRADEEKAKKAEAVATRRREEAEKAKAQKAADAEAATEAAAKAAAAAEAEAATAATAVSESGAEAAEEGAKPEEESGDA